MKIASWKTIGGSGTTGSPRLVGPQLPLRKQGWNVYAQEIQADIDWGSDIIFLHNPFGMPDSGIMQFDEAVICEEDKTLWWLRDGFEDALRHIGENNPGKRLIAYIGMLKDNPNFANLKPNEYMTRMYKSLIPILDAGCEIGLDAAVGSTFQDVTYGLAVMLNAMGVKVWIENWPMFGMWHWNDPRWGTVIVESNYQNIQANPFWGYLPRMYYNTREILRLLDKPAAADWGESQWIVDGGKKILADGDIPALYVGGLAGAKLTRAGVFGG